MREYRSDWTSIALIVGLGIAAAAAEGAALVLIVPLTESVATEAGVGGRIGEFIGDPSPGTVLVLGVIATLSSIALRLLGAFLQIRVVRRIENQQKRRAFAAFIEAQPRAQQAERSGRLNEIVNRANAHADRLGQTLVAIRSLSTVAVFVAGAVVVQPGGALVIVATGGLLFFLFQPLIRASRAASAEATRAQLPIAEHLAEIHGARVEIRTFGADTWAATRFAALVDRLTRARTRQNLLAAALAPLYQGAALLGIFAVLAAARSSDTLDLPSLGAVALLLLRSLSYGQAFQSSYQRMHEMSAVTQAFAEAVEALEGDRAEWGSAELAPVETLELDQLSFSYGGAGRALDGVSCVFQRGDRVGVVGPSGAGKTTLVQLVLRLLRAEEGRVLVNDSLAASYEPGSWAAQVAVVPQHPVLLHASVHDNIAMFRTGMSRADVVRAARGAALEGAIEQLPNGYDTEVGPSSRALSGGQVQRLGLARALAGHPSLLVLDEPTSALDVETEAAIRESLHTLDPDVVVLVIAHRMSTLTFCNRIVVLDGGRLVADGPPSEVAVESRFFEATSRT